MHQTAVNRPAGALKRCMATGTLLKSRPAPGNLARLEQSMDS